jgi:hypothetical protein
VAQLVEALRYKPEGHGLDLRWYHWIFHLHNPYGRTMALGSTQPLTVMSTRNVFWGQRRPVLRADNLTTFMCRLSWNLGAWTFCNYYGLSRPVMGLLYLYLTFAKENKYISGFVVYRIICLTNFILIYYSPCSVSCERSMASFKASSSGIAV